MKFPKIYDTEGVLKTCLSYDLSPEFQEKINAMSHEERIVFMIDEKHFKFEPKKEADVLEGFYRARVRSLKNA